jgi:transcriptional regulator with XRE-family HTH domain
MDSPIQTLRHQLDLSQRELALLIGKSSGHISSLEMGTADLAPDILQELNDIGVNVDDLAEANQVFIQYRREALRLRSIDMLKQS